ncbi:MAG: ATP-grasp domain-containing protein [Thiobacillus sp.]
MPRLLLLLPAAGYANADFVAACERLDIELITCADYCHQLAPGWGLPPLMSVPFDQPDIALPQVLAALHTPVDAVLAVDDHGAQLAAKVRQALRLPGNSPDAVAQLTDKLRFRQLQQRCGLPHPDFALIEGNTAPLPFPLVVKARQLNASRGVIRANNLSEFERAVRHVRAIQSRAQRHGNTALLAERYIDGTEAALDGVLENGQLRVLAVFDKPDPLTGPSFEETLFITPSRLPAATQAAFTEAVAHACAAAGLTHGMIHAEARIDTAGVWLLEIAPRGIGGLCGRVLDATLGMSAVDILLRHTLGYPLPAHAPTEAAGVMMIPIPQPGILLGVDGMAAARAVRGITQIELTAQPGQRVAPPPEGASYLGFIFSRAPQATEVEAALRAAHAALSVRIQPVVGDARVVR